MIRIRKSEDRGRFDHGWLDTRHTFSFADYYDPEHMAFRKLRVINEDRVAPGAGFPTHSHRDMEILTYVLEGALAHRDSMGTGSILRPGEVQRMSAGTGVSHSEFNASQSEPLHLLQIWILPERRGLPPGYEQKEFAEGERRNRLRVVASPDAREGSLTIFTDASLYASVLDAGSTVVHPFEAGRHGWVQVARGRVRVGGEELRAGDGAAISDEVEARIEALEPAELLLFDLA